MEERLKTTGYELLPVFLTDKWCKKTDSVDDAKKVIREINDMGFTTVAACRLSTGTFVDLADEDMEASLELFKFKRETGLH